MKPDPKIVIAGSRAVDRGMVPRVLIRFLAAIPAESTVLLRGRQTGIPGAFEGTVSDLCSLLGLSYEWRRPGLDWMGAIGLDEPRSGREMTFDRDMEMVDDADLVVCFITPEQVGDDTSGTQSLADKALHKGKAVYLYSVVNGRLERVGEQDETDEWAGLLPQTD